MSRTSAWEPHPFSLFGKPEGFPFNPPVRPRHAPQDRLPNALSPQLVLARRTFYRLVLDAAPAGRPGTTPWKGLTTQYSARRFRPSGACVPRL